MAGRVSLIVVSYGTRELLRNCLASIEAARADVDVETIVVDNASSDGSPEMVADRYPHVVLLRNAENVGFARANNQALSKSGGDILFLLNSDTVLLPGSLQALAAAFDTHPEIGVFGTKLLNADGSLQASWGHFPSPRTEFMFQSFLFKVWPVRFPWGRGVHPWLRREYQAFRQTDWVTGASMAFRREVYNTIGGLPEDLFMYGEDLEFCARAVDAGFRVGYLPEASAIHYSQGSRTEYANWIAGYSEGLLRFHEQRRSRRQAAIARTLIVAGCGLRMLLWWIVPLFAPKRSLEAISRRAGYRRVLRRARQGAISPIAPGPAPSGE